MLRLSIYHGRKTKMNRRRIWLIEEAIVMIVMIPLPVIFSILGGFDIKPYLIKTMFIIAEITIAYILQHALDVIVKPKIIRSDNSSVRDKYTVIVFTVLYVMLCGMNYVLECVENHHIPLKYLLIINFILVADHTVFVMIMSGNGEIFRLKTDEEEELEIMEFMREIRDDCDEEKET